MIVDNNIRGWFAKSLTTYFLGPTTGENGIDARPPLKSGGRLLILIFFSEFWGALINFDFFSELGGCAY